MDIPQAGRHEKVSHISGMLFATNVVASSMHASYCKASIRSSRGPKTHALSLDVPAQIKQDTLRYTVK